jgi:hypothetical protein
MIVTISQRQAVSAHKAHSVGHPSQDAHTVIRRTRMNVTAPRSMEYSKIEDDLIIINRFVQHDTYSTRTRPRQVPYSCTVRRPYGVSAERAALRIR